KGGSAGVKDLAGNALVANYTWTFTTAVPGPVANAGPDASAAEGSAVPFAGSAPRGPPNPTHAWNFRDGTTAPGTLIPKHAYKDDGTYTATLTVTDALGRSSSDTAVITVSNVAPTPAISGPPTGAVGAALSFAASATDPSAADTTAGFSYAWDFGDG